MPIFPYRGTVITECFSAITLTSLLHRLQIASICLTLSAILFVQYHSTTFTTREESQRSYR
jgi:hypothetical protein